MTFAIVNKATGGVVITGVADLDPYSSTDFELVGLPEGYDGSRVTHKLIMGEWKVNPAPMIEQIKKNAENAILEIAPLWMQTNALRTPGQESTALFAAIDAIRLQSNLDEAAILAEFPEIV